jgi:hypothetical protein
MVNSISYTGRIINARPEHSKFGKSKGGTTVLMLTIAEQHQGRNDKVEQKFRQADKAPDAYVDTTTSWHKLTLMGDIAEDVAADDRYCHGTLVNVTEASYVEEDPWTDRQGVKRSGRPETIGDKRGDVAIVTYNGTEFVGREPKAFWDGVSQIPPLPSRGGGGGPQYDPNTAAF